MNHVNEPLKKFNRKTLKRSMNHIKWEVRGKVVDIVGNIIHASISGVSLGSVVSVNSAQMHHSVLAEVVGFKGDKAILLPYASITGISPGSPVSTRGLWDVIPVGEFLHF